MSCASEFTQVRPHVKDHRPGIVQLQITQYLEQNSLATAFNVDARAISAPKVYMGSDPIQKTLSAG